MSGVLTDPFGVIMAAVKIKAIAIKAALGNGGNIILKPAAASGALLFFNAVTDEIIIPANGRFVMVAPGLAGWPIVDTSADLINVANDDGSASADYDIAILGTSS